MGNDEEKVCKYLSIASQKCNLYKNVGAYRGLKSEKVQFTREAVLFASKAKTNVA